MVFSRDTCDLRSRYDVLLAKEIGILNGPDQLTRIGSYILYTHMIAQRQRVMRGKKRAN
jgi:hypothetical protein